MDWTDNNAPYCSLDLETNENGEIFAMGAVFKDKTFQRKAPFDIRRALAELDDFASDAVYLLGHNILRHDLPICRAIAPDLKFLNKPVVDTLFLSPLAFPENPYHRLVKDYKLVRDSLNDPLADARLAISLFQDQWVALQEQQQHYRDIVFLSLCIFRRPAVFRFAARFNRYGRRADSGLKSVRLFQAADARTRV